jgi:tRNA pseudouridine55 synthase
MPRRRDPVASGVLVVDKPAGLTSFTVVREVRRRLGERKAGHTGTLDPLATGVLPVCLGEATKIAGLLTADDKAYRATGELGLETDTLDTTGAVSARHDWSGVGREQLEGALEEMLGPQMQVPPAYSALRVEGERAYDRARRGEAVELEPRPVEIMTLSLLDWSPPRFALEVACSKGTYVRSLVDELGRRLGCGAALAALRRTRSGRFTVDQAVPLDQVERGSRLLSIDSALSHLPALEVEPSQADGLRHGQPFAPDPSDPPPGGTLLRLRSEGRLVALGELREGRVWPRRVFVGEHPAAE